MQIQETTSTVRARARMLLAAVKSPKLDFIELAMRGKKIGFEKVIAMIDEMVETLKKEQVEDDNKKEYCTTQFDLADDKKKAFERSIADGEKAITETEETI